MDDEIRTSEPIPEETPDAELTQDSSAEPSLTTPDEPDAAGEIGKKKKSRKPRKEGKKVSIFFAIFLSLLLCGATFLATYSLLGKRHETETAEWKSRLARFSKMEGMLDGIEKSYARDAEESELLENAYHALFEGLDPYSFYMSSEEYDVFASERSGNYAGIGISVVYDPETGGMYVYRVTPDSPAEEAGMKKGMVITAVGSIGVSEQTYQQAVQAVAGEEGTSVGLTVLSDSETRKISVKRGVIKGKYVWYTKLEGGIGLIEIDDFSSSVVADQFKEAVGELTADGCTGCIFDLRGNPGGDLGVITSVLDSLLPEGTIVNIVSGGKTVRTISSDADQSIDLPMAVIVNGSTASAAELFTADLRDYGLAVIVGEKTYGKGTVQSIFRNADGSAYKLTTSYYTPASGAGYDGAGITPDIIVPLTEDGKKTNRFLIPRTSDLQLQSAIAALKDQAESS